MFIFFIPLTLLVTFLFSTCYVAPFLARALGHVVGWYLHRKTEGRRSLILARVQVEEEDYKSNGRHDSASEDDGDWERVESDAASSSNGDKADREWEGIVGFFHPFCNAGGGGERVLWAAIRATQKKYPKAVCVVYTGDHEADKATILERVKTRFNIHLHSPTMLFLYLSTRHYVLSTTYPHFTLLGQSLGSLILAYDAFSLLVPDIFIDTMGYAFTLAFSKLLFPKVPTGAYVHYPTISTDMLGSLDTATEEGGQGVNAGTGKGLKGYAKRKYWHLFARLYSWVGGSVDVVMTNSSWTQNHIRILWGPSRVARHKTSEVSVVFPPVAVEELEQEIDVSRESEKSRQKILLYIAQFRPEKNHALILQAFSEFMNSPTTDEDLKSTQLVLIGSVRNSEDATRVYDLRLLAHELHIKESVTFICDATWPEILTNLRRSSVGVNGMWNEHFGIGVVEYQAAGLISVVNASGGPKNDIVVEYDGGPTGFHATTPSEFASGFKQALSLSPEDKLAMRLRARESAKRFTEAAFARLWLVQMDRLVAFQVGWSGRLPKRAERC
ncbi:MAG: asparagine-linked glycosylation protein [Sarea resinae]|nr:MAG: asparagine-linked glycosylation protein [Sarea resinae]